MKVTVTIGPVPMASARAWLESATGSLAVLRDERVVSVPWDVMAAFEHYLGAWTDRAAAGGDEFLWSDDVDDAVLRRVGLHWARMVSVTRSGRTAELSAAPPEAAAFYDAIVTGIAGGITAGEQLAIADAFVDAVPAFDAGPSVRHTPECTRVLVVDDHEDMRLLLRVWLEGDADFEVAGEAEDGHTAIQVARATKPDVALIDIDMPGLSGIDAIPLIRDAVPTCAVVVLSAGQGRTAALAAGARSFLSKGAPMSAILDAVRAASPRVLSNTYP